MDNRNEMDCSDEMSIQKKNLEFCEQIGAGGMGKVVRVINKATDQELAVKYCIKGSDDPSVDEDQKILHREGQRLSKLDHPNVLKFCGNIISPEEQFVGVAFEYMECGSIFGAKKRMGQCFHESLKYRWSFEIAQAVKYLHSKDIVHKDIKSSNCLLDGMLHAKLGDFGLCRVEQTTMKLPEAATMSHIPPEALAVQSDVAKFSTQYDIYEFGITMYEFLSNEKHPYGDFSVSMITNEVKKGNRPDLKKLSAQAAVIDVMTQCWDQEASRRPSADEVASRLEPVYDASVQARAEEEARMCSQHVKLPRREGQGESFKDFTLRLTGRRTQTQHDGASHVRGPQTPGQQNAATIIQHTDSVNIGCQSFVSSGTGVPQITFEHLSYKQAKVVLDLRGNNIHLRNEQGMVNDDQLRKIANLVSTDFKHLGRCLLFKDPELDTFEHDNARAGITEANQKMLREWHERHAERASRKWLATACLSLKRHDLIDILLQG